MMPERYEQEYFEGLIKFGLEDAGDIAAIARYVTGNHFLEMGCGPGKHSLLFTSAGYKVTGIDNHPTAVYMAKQSGIRAELMNVEDMEFKDDSFDTVFSAHVLEHVENMGDAIAESIRVAKQRVIHLVPIGKCGDKTHKREFMSLDEVREKIKGPDGIPRHVEAVGVFKQNAIVVFFKDMITGHPVLDMMDDFLVIPGYANLVGSAIKATDSKDIDVLIRAAFSDPTVELKITRMFPEELQEKVHFIYHEAGPHGDHIPLFDLTMNKVSTFELRRVSKAALSPLKTFTPLKTASGYAAQEFFTEKDFWTNWAEPLIKEGKKLEVEQKFNGYRAPLGHEGGSTLIFFEDTKKDRSKQFPSLVGDLKAIGKSVILDSDIGAVYTSGKPVERKQLAAFTSDKFIVDEDGTFKTGEGLDASLIVHVFDVLYYDGKDLHTEPWSERRKILEQIFGKHDFKFMKIVRKNITSTKAKLLSEITRVSKVPGSEGAVIKVVGSDYPLTGITPSWAKVKNHVEIKVQVLDKIAVKGGGWNYVVGYTGTDGKIHELGKTFNTKIDVKPGAFLTLAVEEVVPKKKGDVWTIGAVVPKVRDVDTSGRTKPEDIKTIIARADKGNVLQASPAIRKQLTTDKFSVAKSIIQVVKQAEGQLDFKEGDEGTGVLQVHERGLTEDQIKLLGPGFFFGWDPIKLSGSQISRLKKLSPGDWAGAVDKAATGDSSSIVSLLKKIDKASLTTAGRKLIALVEPVSIHTDFRLRPGKKDYWEGGEGFTPGNQFKPNKFRIIEPDFKILANFKIARAGKVVSSKEQVQKAAVVKGPLIWMTIGKTVPKAYPPGAVGSTAGAWSRFKIVDSFKWKAGVQDKHFKEFWFEGGKHLEGRWIFQFVPTGGGVRQWMISRPNKQEMTSDLFKQDRNWTVPILKVSDEKHTVTGVVLEPESTDSHGDIYSAGVIADAMEKFMMDYQRIGVMHRDFTKSSKLFIVQCFIAPQPMKLGNQLIKAGSWIMTVKVLDKGIWADIKAGRLRAFSIGGRARTIPV